MLLKRKRTYTDQLLQQQLTERFHNQNESIISSIRPAKLSKVESSKDVNNHLNPIRASANANNTVEKTKLHLAQKPLHPKVKKLNMKG